MSKILVAFFSCSGVTRRAAEKLAEAAGADLYEIAPENLYSNKDLNWRDQKSRSYTEMHDLKSRPAISGKAEDMEKYDVVFVGYPIWWGLAPTIVNTFLESYDFSGKTIIAFATSGSSSFGASDKYLRAGANVNVKWQKGKLLNVTDKADLSAWIKSLGL